MRESKENQKTKINNAIINEADWSGEMKESFIKNKKKI